MSKAPKLLRSYYRALKSSARLCKILLRDHRYFASVRSGEFLDRDGNYLPWFTFCAVEAITNWDLSDKRVFEYGAGYSTLFWAARAREVVSVEHNATWHEKLSGFAPGNAHLILAAIERKPRDPATTPETRAQFIAYADAIHDQGMFDVIVLDGYARAGLRFECARAALPHLHPTGLVVLDNSDWLPATAGYLRASGLLEVDLSGPAPGNDYHQTTSLFFTRAFDFRPAGDRQPRAPVGGWVANWEPSLERELLERGSREASAAWRRSTPPPAGRT